MNQIKIEVVKGCVYNCTNCILGDAPKDKIENYITMESLTNILNWIKTNTNVNTVLLQGSGEPCLHPDIISIIKQVKDAGLRCLVSTNGVLHLREIIETADYTFVSIDADVLPTYTGEKIRPNIDYAPIIDTLLSVTAGGLAPVTVTSFSPSSYIGEVLSYFNQLFGNKVYVHIQSLDLYAGEQQGIQGTCTINEVEMSIGLDGSIYPCCVNRCKLGDIFQSLEAIHTSDVYTNFWANQKIGANQKCLTCPNNYS